MKSRKVFLGSVAVMVLHWAFASPIIPGAIVTYFVDHSGTDALVNGHVLRVTGIISADTSTSHITASDLTFFHENEPVVAVGGPVPQFSEFFVATDTELRFVRPPLGPQSTSTHWTAATGDGRIATFSLGTGSIAHSLSYIVSTDDEYLFEQAILKPPSGVDHPPGFLIGTAIAVPEPFAGDYNGNGVVDAADYTVWRDGLGPTYTQDDYDVWKSNFGATAVGSGATYDAAVPEPSCLLVFLGLTLGCCYRYRSGC